MNAQSIQLFEEKTGVQWTGMGMTNSYQVAIEEGSNIIRIGTAIFGERI